MESVCKREYLHCTNVCIRIKFTNTSYLHKTADCLYIQYTIAWCGHNACSLCLYKYVHVRRPSGYFYPQVHRNLEHSTYVRCASAPYNVYTYTYKLNLYYNIMATTQWSQSHVHHVNHMYIGICSSVLLYRRQASNNCRMCCVNNTPQPHKEALGLYICVSVLE